MSTHHCSAWELFRSTTFLRVFTRVVGCGPCSGDGTAQSCPGHSEQFYNYVNLCAEHCPCAEHRGDAESVIAVRMRRAAPVRAPDTGPGCGPLLVRGREHVDRSAAHRLRDALDDVRRDRSYKNLRRVYPQYTVGGSVRCAFSERPRRWAQRRDVSRVASDLVDQEALAMLVLTAGWGNPAADLPEDIAPGEHVSFTEDGSAVPVSDLHGRSVSEERDPPLVSTATGDYLLRKLTELAAGRDADLGRTPDQRRRLVLRRLLPDLSGEDLARRLTGVLGRMAVDMPSHFRLVQQARGRARSAPYTPVPDPDEVPEGFAERPRRQVLSEQELTWLSGAASRLAEEAQSDRAAFDSDPRGALDTLVCALLAEDGTAPVRWRPALEDPDVRADLLEALAESAETLETAGDRDSAP
ncbi:hypothetical protein [Nocardiopsis kunsanensis]|uniref:Uncharacterized protein n=1 Tax=Nocardiopsis kunsanensis TaxID=141693 RepID=A0A918XL00_9ACTN|nr:hypothetical protein [Nocardiopsis kunsanensis]GHD36965.1 hypothetical protein GCM10007147_44670 [Nocardiopsis kunsanensis]